MPSHIQQKTLHPNNLALEDTKETGAERRGWDEVAKAAEKPEKESHEIQTPPEAVSLAMVTQIGTDDAGRPCVLPETA